MSDAEDEEHDAQLTSADEPSDRERRDNSEFSRFFGDLIKRAGAEADKSLRLFEQKGGEYFTAHGADAERIADEFFSTREILKNTATLATVNIRPQKLETILKHALLQNGQSVELYARDASSGSGAWLLSKKASPGNLQSFEDLLFHRSEMVENALVMAVRLATGADSKVPLIAWVATESTTGWIFALSPLMSSLFGSFAVFDQLVGVAFADSSAHLLGVCEFTDSERFTAFESLVVQRGARECLLCADAGGQAADLQKLRDILEANGVPFVERKRGA